jgi:iron complex outermembrane receptor protein
MHSRPTRPLARAPRLGVVALLTTIAPDAGAQTASDSTRRTRTDSTRLIESVRVIETRSPATTGGTSAVVMRPDALPIPTQPAPLFEQVLRQTPFVLVRQNSRGESEISVRGSDSRQAAVLLDGLPLTLGWDTRTDPSLVPATGIRRLTVVRGLSTLLAGPNTLGGVLSLEVSGGPGSAGGAAPRPDVAIGLGVDQYAARVLTAAIGGPVAARGGSVLTARGGASYRQRAGVALSRDGGAGDGLTGGAPDPGRDGEGELRTNSDLRQVDGFASLRFQTASGAYAALTGTAFQARRGVAPELHIEEPRLWRYPDASRQLAILSAGTGDVRTPLGRGRLDASVGSVGGDVEIETFESRAYDRVTARELGDERTTTARVVGSHSLPALGQLRLGATLAGVRYDETLDAQSAAPQRSRYRQRLSSVGAEVEWPLFSRLVVSGGAVRDAAETPETGGKPTLGALSRWGWRVGATTAVREAVRLHAAASRRARFPALRELYSGALNRFDPNPTLRPERLTGVEAGATIVSEAVERERIDLQVVGFHHRLDDAVVRVTLPNRLFRRVNRDEIRSTGVELLAGWSPPALRGVAFSADLSAQRVRVYDATLPAGAPNERFPEHQPQLRGSLEVGVPLFGARLAALARHTGRQYCVHPDLGRQVELAPQTVGDAGLSREWPLGGRARGGARLLRTLRATLAMDNVTDATVYDQCGLPQPGRTLRFGIELR